MKWGKPCFTYQKKNVAIVIPLKDACALSFFKGALVNDPKHILQKIGQVQAGRWIKFTSLKEITAMQSILRSYIYEAIEVEESGKKVTFKKAFRVSRFLRSCRPSWMQLGDIPGAAGGIRSAHAGTEEVVHLHVSGAKQVKTRAARAEKCVPMILSGRGFNELTD